MRAILSTFKLLLFGFWSFNAIVLGGFLFLIRKKNGMEWVAKHFWAPVVLRILQAEITVVNGDRIDPTQSYLVMANHNSFIDIPVLFLKMPFYTYFIAKKELRKIPLLGWYIKAYGMIYIDRSDRKKAQKSIQQAGELVANGKRVIIFPEGTKSKDGTIGPFKKGGFHLAEQAQVQILPLKIEGARDVWPNKKPFQLRKGKITVKVGEPIPPESMAGMEINEQAVYLRSCIENL